MELEHDDPLPGYPMFRWRGRIYRAGELFIFQQHQSKKWMCGTYNISDYSDYSDEQRHLVWSDDRPNFHTPQAAACALILAGLVK